MVIFSKVLHWSLVGPSGKCVCFGCYFRKEASVCGQFSRIAAVVGI